LTTTGEMGYNAKNTLSVVYATLRVIDPAEILGKDLGKFR